MIRKNGEGYKIDVRVAGKRIRSSFPTKREAVEFIEAAKLRHKQKKLGIRAVTRSPRISELFRARIAKIPNHAEQVRAKRIFSMFQDLMLGDPFVTEITRGDLQLFINQRDAKPETINREMNLLSKAFRSAPELFPKDLEDYEPPKIPRPKFKRKRRERIITEKEKDLILAFLYRPQEKETVAVHQNRVRIGRMVEMAWLLGLRYSEIAKLLKSDYNREARTLRVRRWKTDTTTHFEFLPDVVCDLLDAAIAASATDYIFTISGSTPKRFYPTFREAVESAGLMYGREKDGGVVFHTLRHSFITRLIRVTDLATAQAFSGHSTGEMVSLYSHASAESKRAAMNDMYSKFDARAIFERVRNGEMTFEEFEKLVQ